MSFLNLLGIGTAYASSAAPQASATSGLVSMLPMILIFVLLIFFFIRPQMKRAKDHRNLVANIGIGDEIITSGGLIGKITKLHDNFMVINIAKEVEITMQKNSIAQVLPKGTIESIH